MYIACSKFEYISCALSIVDTTREQHVSEVLGSGAGWSVLDAEADHVPHTSSSAVQNHSSPQISSLRAATLNFFDTSPSTDEMVSTIPPSRQGATVCTSNINDDDDDLRLATLAIDVRNASTPFGCA